MFSMNVSWKSGCLLRFSLVVEVNRNFFHRVPWDIEKPKCWWRNLVGATEKSQQVVVPQYLEYIRPFTHEKLAFLCLVYMRLQNEFSDRD